MAKFKPPEFWMDAQQYAQLTADDKKAISAAINQYDNAVAAAEQQLTDSIAIITDGKLGTNS